MSPSRAFIPAPALRLAAFHGAVALAALLSSPQACLAALAVSALALARYAAMAGFVSSLGGQAAKTALLGGAWLIAFLALALALAATARLAGPALPWAAAAALAGPLELFAEAGLQGLRRIHAGGAA